jgi:hypothetical protein
MNGDLRSLKVCLDCDLVYAAGEQCPRCTSGVWAWLSKWLAPLGPIAAVALLAFILRGFGG